MIEIDIMHDLEETLEELADKGFFVKLLRFGAVREWQAVLYLGTDTQHAWGSSGTGFSPLEACHDALRLLRAKGEL